MEKRKTALVLGGGGSRGAYEIGVWQALRELALPIDLVTGTSVGAINGAIIAQDTFDLAVSLWKEINTPMIFDVEIKDILTNSGIGSSKLKSLLQQYINEDAVRKSALEYGLVTVELPGMAPKFLMKNQIPQGMLIDYLLASSTLFPAMKGYEINNLKYADGGFTDNLPVGLALDHGATHIIAVNLEAIGVIRKKRLDEADYLKMISCSWDLGNFLIFDKLNAKKIMRLGYLDALKAYDAYDGTYYCFVKGDFDKRGLNGANAAGIIFELNPEVIYKKYIYNIHLKNALDAHIGETEKEMQAYAGSIKGKILEGILKAKTTLKPKTITLMIARSLKEDSEFNNLLLAKPVMKLLKEEILAANYLIKEGIL